MSSIARISSLKWTRNAQILGLARRCCSCGTKHRPEINENTRNARTNKLSHRDDKPTSTNYPRASRFAANMTNQTLDSIVNAAKSSQHRNDCTDTDFFGFDGHGTDIISTGHEEGRPGSLSSPMEKYRTLFVKAPPVVVEDEEEEQVERIFEATFGSVRYDSDNRPRYVTTTGDSQPANDTGPPGPRVAPSTTIGSGSIDEQYFGSFMGGATTVDEIEEPEVSDSLFDQQYFEREMPTAQFEQAQISPNPTNSIIKSGLTSDANRPQIIDQQYLTDTTETIHEATANKCSANSFPAEAERDESASFIDQQYFEAYFAAAREIDKRIDIEKSQVQPAIDNLQSSENGNSSSYIDEQYFAGAQELINEIKRTENRQNQSLRDLEDSNTIANEAKIDNKTSEQLESFIDEQYFDSYLSGARKLSQMVESSRSGNDSKSPDVNKIWSPLKEQYLDASNSDSNRANNDSGQRRPRNAPEVVQSTVTRSGGLDRQDASNFGDHHVGSTEINEHVAPARSGQRRPVSTAATDHLPVSAAASKKRDKFTKSDPTTNEFNDDDDDGNSEFGGLGETSERADRSVKSGDVETKNTEKYRQRLAGVNLQNPKTAYDFVMKRRLEAKSDKTGSSDRATLPGMESGSKQDSKGFKILRDQVRDLELEPEMIVLQILKESILYNDNEIVAISKPYGLPSHTGVGFRHNVDKFLPELAKFVSRGGHQPACERLHLVHRLDRNTTGVLLLAKTQKMAQLLNSLLATHRLKKTYWCLTKAVPHPPEGIIDIPIAEAMVEGSARMVLRPVPDEDTRLVLRKGSARSHRAVTAYRVLSSFGTCALVELRPETGVRHQLRVHLAYGLGCPVLGDHKYSSLSTRAPQKLAGDLLERLGIRQSKVRHLAMHLHARGVSIPGVLEGRDIVIGAQLPSHFAKNMNALRVPKP